jgi:hypothetical protein
MIAGVKNDRNYYAFIKTGVHAFKSQAMKLTTVFKTLNFFHYDTV